jgi:hypothetical protein
VGTEQAEVCTGSAKSPKQQASTLATTVPMIGTAKLLPDADAVHADIQNHIVLVNVHQSGISMRKHKGRLSSTHQHIMHVMWQLADHTRQLQLQLH